MTRNKRNLILASLFIILCMMVLVPLFTHLLGLQAGIMIAMLIYWFGLCLPMAVHFQGWGGIKRSLALTTGGATWVPITAIAVPAIMAIYLTFDIGPFLSLGLMALVLPAALINGTVEEVFWRGTYAKHANGSWAFWAIGLALFTAWHISLLFAVGAVHHGGAVTLLGGAFALGMIWTVMVQRSGHIGWAVISHILVNIIAFSMTLSTQA